MSPTGTTIPATGIGVWEGAAVIGFDRRGIAIRRTKRGMWLVWLSPSAETPGAMYTVSDNTWPLDLTHRPTRLEVMARLGAKVGTDVSEGVLWFGSSSGRSRRRWCVDALSGASALWGPEEDGGASVLPALADLDPTDDTRLDDGARLVDVRALAIVAAQVFTPPA